MIRCIAFDFDGTLVLSNGIKREGFFAIVREIRGDTAKMAEILAMPVGDRHSIFERFAEDTEFDVTALVERYGNWCKERIVDCPAREGADEILRRLRAAGTKIHINSATPVASLRAILLRRYGGGFFDGVHGGYGRKISNLKTIIESEKLTASDVMMVGDGTEDREAAVSVGCPFAGLDGGSLAVQLGGSGLIHDLGGLWSRLVG